MFINSQEVNYTSKSKSRRRRANEKRTTAQTRTEHAGQAQFGGKRCKEVVSEREKNREAWNANEPSGNRKRYCAMS